MSAFEEAKRRAAETYDAASDHYDHPANSFWEKYGARTITRLGLRRGERVFDACCGSGASAIPAAEAVGPEGSVQGVDLAGNLISLAREKSRRRGLHSIEFRQGDVFSAGLPDRSFDAVVCVFGVFFAPDMEAATYELWRLVRPGGRLAITTWGPRFFEPVNSAFWNAVREEEPALYKGFNPWDRLAEVAAVEALLAAAGAPHADVAAEDNAHPLPSPNDWWPMVLGSGYRGTVDRLSDAARARVRKICEGFIRDNAINSVEANVIYAIATKPD